MTVPILTETQERFLRALVERIPTDRIVELHLFSPIRKGAFETGVAVIAATPEAGPAPRIEVHTAAYRLAIKGAERGHWTFEVVTEGDAPLLTVDTVVRGVLTRSDDSDVPERLDGERIAALLGALPVTGRPN
ncbi:MAG: hypothetical protein NVS1B4_24250 [Gemmatimonadaceae bacterium]